MHEESHDDASAKVALQDRLDRAVAAANAIRLAGWLGRTALVAVAVVVGVAAANRILAPAGLTIGRWPVTAVVLMGAIATWWRWAGRSPTRLDVARAIEALHADVGERISRAVAFLDAAKGMTREPPLTRGLRELAIDEAARAMAAVRRVPVPGLRRHSPWAVAGSVAAIALLVSSLVVPPASVHERPGVQGPGDAMAVTPSVDHVQAAARLAVAAAVESRLANMLARRFAAAPGQAVESLSDEQRRDLATLAEIHEGTLHALQRIRSEVAQQGTATARAAMQQLETLDDATGEGIGEAITANRLASAAAGAKDVADTLAALVRSLGGEESHRAVMVSQLPSHEIARVRRVETALAEIARRSPHRRHDGDGRRVAKAAARQTADRDSQPDQADRSVTPPGGESAGELTSAATSEPRFVAGESIISRPFDEQARPQARVWSLLPAASRPHASSGGEAEVPPEYRAAVDLYYQLVLESLKNTPTERRFP